MSPFLDLSGSPEQKHVGVGLGRRFVYNSFIGHFDPRDLLRDFPLASMVPRDLSLLSSMLRMSPCNLCTFTDESPRFPWTCVWDLCQVVNQVGRCSLDGMPRNKHFTVNMRLITGKAWKFCGILGILFIAAV